MKNPDLSNKHLSNTTGATNRIWAILIGIAGFLLYINTVANQYVLDDSYAIAKNQFVQEGFGGIFKIFTVDFWYFANLKLGYYRPLSLVTFAVEHEFFSNNPGISHGVNALLYGLTCYILFHFLQLLFPKKNLVFALLVCLVFIAHPIHTEVVANIKSRDEILSFLNVITMCLFAFKFTSNHKMKDLVLSLLFFYLGLISKETALVGIVLLPVFFYFSGFNIGNSMKRMLPYAAVVALFFIQKQYFLGNIPTTATHDIINYPYSAASVKLPTAFHIFALCLQKMVLPWPLKYNYCYNEIPSSNWTDPGTWIGVFLALGFIYIMIRAWKTRSVFSLGIAIVFLTVAPSLAFVFLRGGGMAERFLYAPILGFALLLVSALSMIKVSDNNEVLPVMGWIKNHLVACSAIFIVFMLFSGATISRNTAWKDELTLYATDAPKLENNCQLHLHYGTALLEKDTAEKDPSKKLMVFNQALKELKHALIINPAYGEAYYQMGFGYQMVEVNADSAIKIYKKALELIPGYAMADINLGVLYAGQGKPKLASYYFNKGTEANPMIPEGAAYAAHLKKETGLDIHEFPGEDEKPVLPVAASAPSIPVDPQQAKNEKIFEEDIKKGGEAVQKKEYAVAIDYFSKASKIHPDNIQNLIYLANSYGMAQKYNDAIKTFELILTKEPANQVAIKNLIQTYEFTGQKAKADALRKSLVK